jgi:integrase
MLHSISWRAARNPGPGPVVVWLETEWPGSDIHDLRHTALTELAESGASDSTIMALAGHLSRATLERYSHIRMNAKRQAVESLSLKPKVEQTPQRSPQSEETAPVFPTVKPS